MCTQTDRVITDVDGVTGQCCTSLTFKLALKTIEFKEDVMFSIEKKGSILTDLPKQSHVIVGFFFNLCF